MTTIRTATLTALLVALTGPNTAAAQEGRDLLPAGVAAEPSAMQMSVWGPGRVASEYFAPSDEGDAPVSLPPIQTASYGRTWAGLGMGTTLAALLFTQEQLSFMGNCEGSGDIYLDFCRLIFVGGATLGGGVGALIGRSIRSVAPAGRATPALMGSAIGAWATFLASIPACGPNNGDNPERLCGFSGMPRTSTMAAVAAAGGLVGFLTARNGNAVRLDHLGLVPTDENGGAMRVALSFSVGR